MRAGLDIKGTNGYRGEVTLGHAEKNDKYSLRRHKLLDNENTIKFSRQIRVGCLTLSPLLPQRVRFPEHLILCNSLRPVRLRADIAERSWWEPEDPRVQSFALDYLTPHQRRARQKQWENMFEAQKLFTLDQVRKCLVSHCRVALVKSIFIHLADHDVSGVRRLMGQQRRDGVSMHGILHGLEQAVNGTYRAKGYSEDNFDSAILSMRLGGQALLHALHKAAGFSGASLVYAKTRERSVSDKEWELYV